MELISVRAMSSTPKPDGPLIQSLPQACLSDQAVCDPGRFCLTTSKIVFVWMKLWGYTGTQSVPTLRRGICCGLKLPEKSIGHCYCMRITVYCESVFESSLPRRN